MIGNRKRILAAAILAAIPALGWAVVTIGEDATPLASAWTTNASAQWSVDADGTLVGKNFLAFDRQPIATAPLQVAPGWYRVQAHVSVDDPACYTATQYVRVGIKSTVTPNGSWTPKGVGALEAWILVGEQAQVQVAPYNKTCGVWRVRLNVRRVAPTFSGRGDWQGPQGGPIRDEFLIGFYDTSGYPVSESRLDEIRDMDPTGRPMLYLNYWHGRVAYDTLLVQLNRLRARNMYWIHTANQKDAAYEDYLRANWPLIAAHPATMAAYVSDEDDVAEAQFIRDRVQLLESLHPGTVTFGAENNTRRLEWFHRSTTILEAHRYVIREPEGLLVDFTPVCDGAAEARRIQGGRPVWSVLQWYPADADGRYPTEDDMRAQVQCALPHSNAILFWSYGSKGLAYVKDPILYQQKRTELKRVIAEIRAVRG